MAASARRSQRLAATRTEAATATPTPVPSAVYLSYFPANVRVPDGDGRLQINNVKVFLTPEGVYVYDRVPLDPRQTAEATPRWFSPLNLDNTPRPAEGIKARSGVALDTEAGPVVVTPLGGCGCGMRPLRDWLPTWATTVRAWPESEGV